MQAHFRQMEHECAAIEAGTTRLSERDALIVKHYRVAVGIASEYKNQGLPMEDLIGFAYIGLTEAADRWQPERGIVFASFATVWCRKEVIRGLTETARPIRLPIRKQMLATRIRKEQERISARTGQDASPAELAEKLGTDARLVSDLLTATEPMKPISGILRKEQADRE